MSQIFYPKVLEREHVFYLVTFHPLWSEDFIKNFWIKKYIYIYLKYTGLLVGYNMSKSVYIGITTNFPQENDKQSFLMYRRHNVLAKFIEGTYGSIRIYIIGYL